MSFIGSVVGYMENQSNKSNYKCEQKTVGFVRTLKMTINCFLPF
ncbi:hypothetical protein PLUTE_a5223 [Pseudoalteromonas luteoviolacea DSM 6061]|nr:hypothetical protein [Pseudoalteromonas luteoviolacea DSM 6061]